MCQRRKQLSTSPAKADNIGRARKETGIPLPDDHREMLDAIAADLGIGPPEWRD